MAQQPVQTEDIQKELDVLEKRITQLKVNYDQYFLGMEKFEPHKERGDINRVIIELAARYLRNTGAKFRRDSLKAKFLSYTRYWDRILKQIEDGTYKGHQVKAALHERERLAKMNGKIPDQPVNGEITASVTGVKHAAAPASGPKPAAPGDPMQKIFEQYVAAKRKANESVEGITRDKLASVITQQTQVLKQKYNCKSVEFRVVVEDGKAKLKAVPKA
jgi:hypothetical protein